MPNDREDDIIKSLEDALKFIDGSNLPPSPDSGKPIPVQPTRSVASDMQNPHSPQSTFDDYTASTPLPMDKYGIPSSSPKRKVASSSAGRRVTPSGTGRSSTKADWRDNLPSAEEPIQPSANTSVRPSTSLINSSRASQPSGIAGFLQRCKAFFNPTDDEPDVVHGDKRELDTGSADFKMKFDFESAYKDIPEDRPIRLRRERRTGLIGGLMLATFILCVGLIVASVLWMATVDILGFASEDELVSVVIPPDFTMEGVTDILLDAGLIRYRALFTLYAEYSNAEEKITSGSFILNRSYDYRALVQGMTARAGVRVETTVTIPEGYTLARIFILLENEGVCSADALWEAAANHEFNFHFLDNDTLGDRLRLEGFLFPDTYNFFENSTPTQALLRMLRGFDRRFTEEYIERAEYMGLTIHEVIIIASLIEREAGNDEERPRIAAVIYNRLESPNFPRLEIDATIHYAIAGTRTPFSTQLDSEFNTYIHEGLPPGAIANPGMASIRAALWPASTNEYFYALNRYGSHNFFTNYDDHRNFVNSDEYGGRQ